VIFFKELSLSFENPHRKIFPNSNWELYKWDKVDVIGFLLSIVTLVVIIALLYAAVAFVG
jgi:hypothetical protein